MGDLAIGFKDRCWRVQVVSMLPLEPMADRLRSTGVTVATLNMRPGVPNPFAITRLTNMLKEFGTEVLHSHLVKANLLGRLSGRLARVPVQISTAHNTVEGGAWVQWAYRLTDSLADVTTNVSQRAVDRYVDIGAVPRDRIKLMRNGIEVSVFRRDAGSRSEYRADLRLDNAFVWLAVGRLAPSKDYANMIAAFADLACRRQDAKLLIVGKGPLEGEVLGSVESAGLSRSVLMLGERDDVPALMNAADAYVMSSAWEGAPIVLLEASASSLPIVTTDVGGNHELIDDGNTGLIVPPGDSEALAEAMLRIMEWAPERRAVMGRAARERIEREFDMNMILDQWETLYLELLERESVEV